MDEVWLRIVVVAVVFATAVGIAMARRGRQRAVRMIPSSDLDAGLYLFSSDGCATCDAARALLADTRGDGFVEFVWEQHPQTFQKLAIDAVPSVLLVDETGSGRLYPGQPKRALREL